MDTRTFFTTLINIVLAIFLIAEGVIYFAAGGYYNPVKIPLLVIPGGYAGVLPISMLMMGFFLIGLNVKFGSRAIPILMMSIGAFDVFGNLAGIPWFGVAWYFSSDKIWYFQVALMVVGYFLAMRIEEGKPSFLKLRFDGWFAVLAIVFIACVGIDFSYGQKIYHIYEATLYIWVWYAGSWAVSGPQAAPNNLGNLNQPAL